MYGAVMPSHCFILLVIFLSKCLGHTEFIYTAKDEVKLFCNTSKWQISSESDNKINVSCTVECVLREPLNRTNFQYSCTSKDSDKVGEKCPLIARSGFFRCVTALDPGFLFPFKPSPNTVTSYIVATANEGMTTRSEERSRVELTEGEDVLLNCSFIFTQGYDKQEFTVYWIRTIEKSSICVYSYDHEQYSNGIKNNHHCSVQEELRYRLSYQTEGRFTHNIRISNITESDAGRYLCALQVRANGIKAEWKIINNITVSLHKGQRSEIAGDISVSGTVTEGGAATDPSSTDNVDLRQAVYILYAIIPILLALAVAGFIWKKTKTSPGSQAVELQRNRNGNDKEETADMECSPYAVSSREEEIKFSPKPDALKSEGQEESTDLYSVIKQNDLYEPGA